MCPILLENIYKNTENTFFLDPTAHRWVIFTQAEVFTLFSICCIFQSVYGLDLPRLADLSTNKIVAD